MGPSHPSPGLISGPNGIRQAIISDRATFVTRARTDQAERRPLIRLALYQTKTLRDRFLPDRPGPLVGLHVSQTGHGECFADRWPDPRAVLVKSGENYSLDGDPAALTARDLTGRIEGYVEAPESFVPLLWAAFDELAVWDRVMLELPGRPRMAPARDGVVRRLEPADATALARLDAELTWISSTWGGPAGLAASGYAWGAFAAGRLISVACSFFLGERYEDIGVVTESAFRGRGASGACARALCEEIRARGRRPGWTTSPDNAASLRVAEKLGFKLHHRDQLYLVGLPSPEPGRPGGS